MFIKKTESCATYRQRARASLQGQWTMGAVATLITHGLVTLVSAIPWIGWAANFLVFPLYYGYDRYFLMLIRAQPQPLSSLLDGFKAGNAWRTIWAYMIAMTYILLWACLLLMPAIFFFSLFSQIGDIALGNPTLAPQEIWHQALHNLLEIRWSTFTICVLVFWSVLLYIPTMIACARYSMIGLILVDRPDLGAVAAIRESARITQGHKIKIVKLFFSFAGWAFLAIFVTGGLGFLWLSAYYRTALSHLYEDIKP